MPDISDVHEALLRVICRAGSHQPSAVVDVGLICRDQGLNSPAVHAAVVALADAQLVDYLGAGPRVSVTEAGALRCAELDPLPSLEGLKAQA